MAQYWLEFSPFFILYESVLIPHSTMSLCERCPGEQEEKVVQAERYKGRTLSELYLKPLTNLEIIIFPHIVSLCSSG